MCARTCIRKNTFMLGLGKKAAAFSVQRLLSASVRVASRTHASTKNGSNNHPRLHSGYQQQRLRPLQQHRIPSTTIKATVPKTPNGLVAQHANPDVKGPSARPSLGVRIVCGIVGLFGTAKVAQYCLESDKQATLWRRWMPFSCWLGLDQQTDQHPSAHMDQAFTEEVDEACRQRRKLQARQRDACVSFILAFIKKTMIANGQTELKCTLRELADEPGFLSSWCEFWSDPAQRTQMEQLIQSRVLHPCTVTFHGSKLSFAIQAHSATLQKANGET